jgi:hypothetical protein
MDNNTINVTVHQQLLYKQVNLEFMVTKASLAIANYEKSRDLLYQTQLLIILP